jgi:hypothetical protein
MELTQSGCATIGSWAAAGAAPPSSSAARAIPAGHRAGGMGRVSRGRAGRHERASGVAGIMGWRLASKVASRIKARACREVLILS